MRVTVSSSGVSNGAHHSMNLSQLSSTVGNGSRGRLSSLPKVRVLTGGDEACSGPPGAPEIELSDRRWVDAVDVFLGGREPVIEVGVNDGRLVEEEKLD